MTLLISSYKPTSSSDMSLLTGHKVLVLAYSYSALTPNINNIVASPPSSTIEVGPLPSGHLNADKVLSQYSS